MLLRLIVLTLIAVFEKIGIANAVCNTCNYEAVIGFVQLCEPRFFAMDHYIMTEIKKWPKIDESLCKSELNHHSLLVIIAQKCDRRMHHM